MVTVATLGTPAPEVLQVGKFGVNSAPGSLPNKTGMRKKTNG